MRLIDADALMEKAWDADTRVGYVQVVDVGDIKDAPTVEPEPHWIPCSERLPDKEGRYLVWAVMSFVPDHVDEPNTYQGTTIASYFERLTPFKWFGDHVEQVIAWMPLPKPYMEGEQ